MTELRVVVPQEVAERLAAEAAERGSSAEGLAAEVLEQHTAVSEAVRVPAWVGAIHSRRGDLSERHEEILKSELSRDG